MEIHSERFNPVSLIWTKVSELQSQMLNHPCIIQKWKQDDMEMSSAIFRDEEMSEYGEGMIRAMVRRELASESSGLIEVSHEGSHLFINYDFRTTEVG